MDIEIISYTLGPLENNSFLIIDTFTNKAAIVDPSFGSERILKEMVEQYSICQIWCTHAHFDHIAGINEIIPNLSHPVEILLHENDLGLWESNGGANIFGFPFEIKSKPSRLLQNDDSFKLGELEINSFFTPGHTSGHVIYSIKNENVVFVGDLIFRMSVGRTDLPGGNHLQLLKSIDNYIKPLPDDTRLLSGHGPETTVGYEKKYNPFL
ncbi:MAG TPA: MBL fold metallo-hydrolase [Anaerolineaceae bacterium]|nr:MBL fold metallo-hydrolase [Anaerolineaceae bacterium]